MKILEGVDFGTHECPSCGCDVAANHNVCPLCGYLFPIATPRQKHMRRWGALIMLGLIAFLYLLRYL